MSSQEILAWSLTIAEISLILAMMCATFRVVRGPRAQDRVLGLDALYVDAALILVVFGIDFNTTLYFEIAVAISLLGFVGTVALAKFLMRGEVIE